jgi:hypothetical protein
MKTFREILEEELEESVTPVRKRINPSVRRKRKINYLKNKQKKKLQGKRYRRTSDYKRWKRKTEVKSKTGRTATGKRKSTLVR